MKAIAVCASVMLAFLALCIGPAVSVDAQEADESPDQDGGPPCDPYPVGRCGDHQREEVVFCYVQRDGLYVSATDDGAIGIPGGAQNLGIETGVPDVDEAAYYVRQEPTDTFLADPNTAPFPFKTFFEESNNVRGLQPEPFKCGKWTWFAECVPQQWMGPTGLVDKFPDSLLV